jgi:ribosomal protein S18 acetylase RimI-like enzyme
MEEPIRRREEETAAEPATAALKIRDARKEDSDAVAGILAEAFPALYRATFGPLDEPTRARLLTALYDAGTLSLTHTRVCERDGKVIGLAVLHVGESIGRGRVGDYWRLLVRQLGLWRAVRAFCGSLFTNAYLNGRIPHAADLVYIEALAVASEERGHGIGTRLLHDAVAWTQAHGRSRLALNVLQSNTGARRLYERLGFRLWHEESLRARLIPSWGSLLMARPTAE